tara:strand:+ start:6775 stop:7479 length:705 start_codon:yes stop_codon:yes gene_type:complete
LNKGKLYLIPTVLGEETQKKTLSTPVFKAIKEINIFIVENIRTSRRHIKKIDKKKNIDKTIFYCNGKYEKINLKEQFLPHILEGNNVGLLSESGNPCIADPGSEIVMFCHNYQIEIIPLVGPSSIILALISSGMNGQNFTFNGYLPINKKERIKKIKQLEELSKKTQQTQIFMETPYRNMQLLETLLQTCNNNTKLCIASNITLTNQNIKTREVIEWKKRQINIHKKPTIFLIG